MEVFGESKVLRTTNSTLNPATKLELLCLYSKCYGHCNVTNNDLYLWFVKGYVVQEKCLDIDWAKVVASTAREKFKRVEIAKWKLVHGATSGSRNRNGTKSLAFLIMDDGSQHLGAKDSKA
jgi:hypothetical protein